MHHLLWIEFFVNIKNEKYIRKRLIYVEVPVSIFSNLFLFQCFLKIFFRFLTYSSFFIYKQFDSR